MSDETKKTAKPAKAVADEAKTKTAKAKTSAKKAEAKPAKKPAAKTTGKTVTKVAGKATGESAGKAASKSAGKVATKSTAKTKTKTATMTLDKSALDKSALDKSKAKAAMGAKPDSKADADAKAKSKDKPEVEVKVVKSKRKKSASAVPADAEAKTAKPTTPAQEAPQTDAKDTTPPQDQTQDQAQAVVLDSETSTQASTNGSDGKGEVTGGSPVYEVKIDSLGRAYATGRRKEASARVWIKPGTGQVSVNGRDVKIYFARPVLRMLLGQPFVATGKMDAFDVTATVKGGGLSGQAGAVRHGISHALVRFDPELRPRLKAGGFLTRDSRAVERKKYGRRKARRSFQFSKR